MFQRALIVGRDGLVGRHLFRAFQAVDSATPGTSRRGNSRLFLDLARPRLVAIPLAELGVHSAVICAAVSRVDECQRDPAGSFQINVTGTLDLVEQLWKLQVFPVFFSTDYVFEGTDPEGYADDAPLNPTTEYGRQKWAVERALAGSGKPYLILRLGKTFGLEKGDSTLLDEMASRFRAGQSFGAAYDQVFCPLWAGDLPAIVGELLARGKTGTFNVCHPTPWSRYDLALALAKQLGTDPGLVRRISLDDLPTRRPKCTRLIPRRLLEELEVKLTPMEWCLSEIASPNCRLRLGGS